MLRLVCPSLAWAQSSKPSSFDGNWWLAASKDEKAGYIEGDNDCYTFELRGRVRNTDPVSSYASFVTTFYQRHPSALRIPVREILVRASSQRPKVKREDGEVYKEPHGYYDGLFWKQSSRPEQVGYVEGYLACYEGEAHSPKGAFSKPPAQYVSLITGWYQSTRKEDAKIADVLFKFRDNPQSSKAGSK